MRAFLSLLILTVAFTNCSKKISTKGKLTVDLITPFEMDTNYSASHDEVVAFYEGLAFNHAHIQANRVGVTDSGRPLHEIIISKDNDFNPASVKSKGKAVLFINNAIHPGEPCGVDASMMLTRDFAIGKFDDLLENVVVVIVPMYNVGGSLNRGSYSRANQQGPKFYGFRGNAQNLDLNRDFIKCDSRNAQTFTKIFNRWNPDVFIDNHTSNGADYQYVMTLIATQKDKLAKPLADLMQDKMLPDLYEGMKDKEYQMTPYVYVNNTPDDGIAGFLDLPRYSSGFAVLHNAISFMPESHMLKSFADRVRGTYSFSVTMLEYLKDNHKDVLEAKAKSIRMQRRQRTFDLNWTIDREQGEELSFNGYKAMYKASAVTGEDRLYYDHKQPYTKKVPFYNSYKSTAQASKPKSYIIPQAYEAVIDRLKANGVKMTRLAADGMMPVEMYYIEDYNTRKSPYEKHYLHNRVELKTVSRKHQYLQGDYVVTTDQDKVRFIMETLEPQAADSYFAWNFFDGILMQKEHFSAYVFEDTAARMLQNDADLKVKFEKMKNEDAEFAKSARTQLNWLYEQSPHYEPTFKLYPVGRVVE